MDTKNTIRRVVMSLSVLSTCALGIHHAKVSSELEYAKRQIEKKDRKIHVLSDTVLNNQKELQSQKEYINQLQTQVEQLNADNQSLRSKVQDQQAEIDRLRQSIQKSSGVSQKSSDNVYYVIATAYTPNCKGCIGITKTGYSVKNTIYYDGKRVISVDPNLIPLNSIVKVTTENGESFIASAIDTGGAIKGHRIDVLVENRQQAIQFGRQKARVEIISRGN